MHSLIHLIWINKQANTNKSIEANYNLWAVSLFALNKAFKQSNF
jgi:hypothetical protein